MHLFVQVCKEELRTGIILTVDHKKQNWYLYMEPEMKELADESFKLLEHSKSPFASEAHFNDFGFVLFPMAKAYEGFLKKAFLDLKLIDKRQFFGDHFRIGRALNPNLPKRYRAGWVFGKLISMCGGEQLPMQLWNTWKEARNRVFHYFPGNNAIITLSEAEMLLGSMDMAMERLVEGCGLPLK